MRTRWGCGRTPAGLAAVSATLRALPRGCAHPEGKQSERFVLPRRPEARPLRHRRRTVTLKSFLGIHLIPGVCISGTQFCQNVFWAMITACYGKLSNFGSVFKKRRAFPFPAYPQPSSGAHDSLAVDRCGGGNMALSFSWKKALLGFSWRRATEKENRSSCWIHFCNSQCLLGP